MKEVALTPYKLMWGLGGDVTECNRGGDAVHAPVDEQVAVSDDDMEGGAVKFPVEMGPGVAQDEEGGGDVPTPNDEGVGRLRIMVIKQECFAHGGEAPVDVAGDVTRVVADGGDVRNQVPVDEVGVAVNVPGWER